MKIVLKLLKNEKTQVLNNVISITELGDIIQIKTTQEEFKVDKNEVKISVFINSSNVSNREKLISELNKRIDDLLELQKQNRTINALDEVEKIKNYIKKYEDVEEKYKQELIDNIDKMVLEIFFRTN